MGGSSCGPRGSYYKSPMFPKTVKVTTGMRARRKANAISSFSAAFLHSVQECTSASEVRPETSSALTMDLSVSIVFFLLFMSLKRKNGNPRYEGTRFSSQHIHYTPKKEECQLSEYRGGRMREGRSRLSFLWCRMRDVVKFY